MWEFWTWTDLFAELQQRPEPERRAVRDDLSALLLDPYDPPGLVAFRFRGLDPSKDIYCAELSHGWHVTYQPAPNGLPPAVPGRHVVLRSLDHLPDIQL